MTSTFVMGSNGKGKEKKTKKKKSKAKLSRKSSTKLKSKTSVRSAEKKSKKRKKRRKFKKMVTEAINYMTEPNGVPINAIVRYIKYTYRIPDADDSSVNDTIKQLLNKGKLMVMGPSRTFEETRVKIVKRKIKKSKRPKKL